mgnify:CR=1 FL=1
MGALYRVKVQQVLRERVEEHVAAIVERAAGRTCGTCWRFRACDLEPASPAAVACWDHAVQAPTEKR